MNSIKEYLIEQIKEKYIVEEILKMKNDMEEYEKKLYSKYHRKKVLCGEEWRCYLCKSYINTKKQYPQFQTIKKGVSKRYWKGNTITFTTEEFHKFKMPHSWRWNDIKWCCIKCYRKNEEEYYKKKGMKIPKKKNKKKNKKQTDKEIYIETENEIDNLISRTKWVEKKQLEKEYIRIIYLITELKKINNIFEYNLCFEPYENGEEGFSFDFEIPKRLYHKAKQLEKYAKLSMNFIDNGRYYYCEVFLT